MNKPHEIIRAFKLCIKEYKRDNKVCDQMYYEAILEQLLKEVRGEPNHGLMKYFEDYLPTTSKDYFEYLYHTHNPVRNIMHWKVFQSN